MIFFFLFFSDGGSSSFYDERIRNTHHRRNSFIPDPYRFEKHSFSHNNYVNNLNTKGFIRENNHKEPHERINNNLHRKIDHHFDNLDNDNEYRHNAHLNTRHNHELRGYPHNHDAKTFLNKYQQRKEKDKLGKSSKSDEDEIPFFDPTSPTKVTAQLGSHAYLPCSIQNLGDKSVSKIFLS